MNRLLRAGAFLLLITVFTSCGDDPTPPAENRAPTLGDLTATLAEDSSVEVDVLAAASDPDGGTLTLTSMDAPAHGAATRSGGVLTYVPDADYHGTDQVGVTVSDGEATVSGTVSLTITPVNDAPVAVEDPAGVYEEDPTPLDVLANDTDVDGDALTLVAAFGASHGTAELVDSRFVYTSDVEYAGADTARYVVSDGALQDTGTVALVVFAVNDAPTAVADEATGAEDETLGIDVLANDSDAEGDPITIASFDQPTHGTVVAGAPGLSYTPGANFHGTDTFVYSVTDGVGGVDSATVTVTIEPVPDKPVAGADTIEIDENASALFDLLANDSDADGDALEITAVGSPTHGAAAIEDGQVRYTPETGFDGSDAFDYVAADGTGLTDTATVTVTVTNVNGAPVAGDDALTVNEDEWGQVHVLVNDTDPDGDSLRIRGYFEPDHGSVSYSDGVVRYKGDLHYNGPDSFRYRVGDGNGGMDTATVTVTVEPVDDWPNPQPDSATVAEDGTILIDVFANDIEVDGDSLMVDSTTWHHGLMGPIHGTAAWENEQLRYTPDADYNGTDSLSYWVTDHAGEAAHVAGEVYLTITPVNDAPVPGEDNATVPYETPTLIDVLANDVDPDGDSLSVVGTSNGQHGAVYIDGNQVRYEPVSGYTGSDSFSYDVSDGNGGVASSTVWVTVTAAGP